MNDRVSWINPKLDVRESKSHGKEVFARCALEKDERLAVFGGSVMEVRDEPEGDYALQIADDLVIGRTSPLTSDNAEYFNHSCDPNAGFRGQIFLMALRGIKAGEQVCFDYAMVVSLDTYRFNCNCGSSQCRNVVTGEDWKNASIQDRYAGYFSWSIQEKINQFRQAKTGKQHKPWQSRIAELSVGFTVNKLLDYSFDFLLYPFVIFKLGLLLGGTIMALLSFATCLLILRAYDWSKRDWLGIEAIKSLKAYDGPNRFARCAGWMLRRGDFVACVALSIQFDPFITTAYMRHGAYNGMNRRDWRFFILSWLIGNAYWSLACLFGITILAWCWLKLKVIFGFGTA